MLPPTRFHCPDPDETNSHTSEARPIVAVVAAAPIVSDPARFRVTAFDPPDHFTANLSPAVDAAGRVTVTPPDAESIS